MLAPLTIPNIKSEKKSQKTCEDISDLKFFTFDLKIILVPSFQFSFKAFHKPLQSMTRWHERVKHHKRTVNEANQREATQPSSTARGKCARDLPTIWHFTIQYRSRFFPSNSNILLEESCAKIWLLAQSKSLCSII